MSTHAEVIEVIRDLQTVAHDAGQMILHAENDGSIDPKNMAYIAGWVGAVLAITNSLAKFQPTRLAGVNPSVNA